MFEQLAHRCLYFGVGWPRESPVTLIDLHSIVVDVLEEEVKSRASARHVAFLCAILDATHFATIDDRVSRVFWEAVGLASDSCDVSSWKAWPFRSRHLPRRLFGMDMSPAGLQVVSRIYQLNAHEVMWPGGVQLDHAKQRGCCLGLKVNKNEFLDFLTKLGSVEIDGGASCVTCGKGGRLDDFDVDASCPKFTCSCGKTQSLPPPMELLDVAVAVAPSAECLVQLYVVSPTALPPLPSSIPSANMSFWLTGV